MKNGLIILFILLYNVIVIGANIAHPFTPELMVNLNQPDYMFGLVFSTMAFLSFAFSPFFGSMGDRFGRIKVIAFTTIGYAFGQFLFGISTDSFSMLFARAVSGMFSAGFTVNSLAYIIDVTTDENRGKYMAYFVAIKSLCVSIGFLLGGIIADGSIKDAFNFQVMILIFASVIMYLLMIRYDIKSENFKKDRSSINPFKSFLEAKDVLTKPMVIFMIIVFLSGLSMQGFDNSFNYYLKADLNFSPAYNGIIKASIGVLSLIANFTINIWILKKFDQRKSLSLVLILNTISIFAVVFTTKVSSFLLVSIIYYVVNAIYLPILQSLISKNNQVESSNGKIAGIFQAFYVLGTVIGPLISSFIYSYGSKIPFIMVSITFFIGVVLSIINKKQYDNKP